MPRSPGHAVTLDGTAEGWRAVLGRPRLAVGVVLIVSGVVWAAARGLDFYGLTPVAIAYNLDQPPLLLVMVGSWLLYRSRAR